MFDGTYYYTPIPDFIPKPLTMMNSINGLIVNTPVVNTKYIVWAILKSMAEDSEQVGIMEYPDKFSDLSIREPYLSTLFVHGYLPPDALTYRQGDDVLKKAAKDYLLSALAGCTFAM